LPIIPQAIIDIRLMGIPPQILQPIIRSVVIAVATLQTGWSRSHESFQDQMMNEARPTTDTNDQSFLSPSLRDNLPPSIGHHAPAKATGKTKALPLPTSPDATIGTDSVSRETNQTNELSRGGKRSKVDGHDVSLHRGVVSKGYAGYEPHGLSF
jgi:hypothetical protein